MILEKGNRYTLESHVFSIIFNEKTNYTDHAIFVSDKNKKLLSDDYMIFYAQPTSPCKSVAYNSDQGHYKINLNTLPENAEKLTLTFSTSVDYKGDLSQIPPISLNIGNDILHFSKQDAVNAKALMLIEIYKHKGVWKIWTLTQGYSGGLADLVKFFGSSVTEEVPKSIPQINLTKERLIKLEKESSNTKLINLAKTANNVLLDYGIQNHTADVALIIDFSLSMTPKFKDGFVQKIADQLMAAGVLFDDNSSIDVFLFDHRAIHLGEMTVKDFSNKIALWENKYKLGHDTKYGSAIKCVMEYYLHSTKRPEQPSLRDKPIYAFFLTDGDASDKALATRLMRDASYYPIFWQFVGIHTNSFSSFDYLERLDDLDGRYVDNANFFEIKQNSLNSISDKELFEKMFTEYPSWLKISKERKLIK